MRLPYIPDDPQMDTPESQAIVSRIKARRGGSLLALDKTLLHSPPVADGWNAFLKAIRTQTSLDPSLRELAITRVAALNRAWYEWEHHVPILREAGVLGEEMIERIKEREWDGEGLDERHLAVLRYTDAMTKDVIVREGVFQLLRKQFSDREIVEITSTVAAYNTVSRFLVALDVGEMVSLLLLGRWCEGMEVYAYVWCRLRSMVLISVLKNDQAGYLMLVELGYHVVINLLPTIHISSQPLLKTQSAPWKHSTRPQ